MDMQLPGTEGYELTTLIKRKARADLKVSP